MQSTSSVPYLKPIAIFACGCYQELNASCLDGFIQQLNSIVEGVSGFVIPLEFSFQSDQLTHFDGITLLECLQVSDFQEQPILAYSWLTVEAILRIRPSSALLKTNTFFKQMPFDFSEYISKLVSLKPQTQTQTSMVFSDLTSTYHDMANDYYGAYRLWLGFMHGVKTHAKQCTEQAEALQSSQMPWWAKKEMGFKSLPYKLQQAKLQSLPITRPQYPDCFNEPSMLRRHLQTGIDKKWRILYIDDEYDKGYADVLRSMFFFSELASGQLNKMLRDSTTEGCDAWEQTSEDSDKNTRFVACSNVESAKHWLKDWGILKLNPAEQNQSLENFLKKLNFFLAQSPKKQAELIFELDPDQQDQSQIIKLYRALCTIDNKNVIKSIIKNISKKNAEQTIKFLEKLSSTTNKKLLTKFKKNLNEPKIEDGLVTKSAQLLKAAIEKETCLYRPRNSDITNKKQFIEAEKKRLQPTYTTMIFLDLKLEPHRDTGTDIRQYTSIQLLENISKQSPGTPVILFTASRQILNYLQIFDSSIYRIKGWFVKEAPDMPESPENSMHAMYYLLRKCHTSSHSNESNKVKAKKLETNYELFLTKNAELIAQEKQSLYALIDLYSDAILNSLLSGSNTGQKLESYIKDFLDEKNLNNLSLSTLKSNKIGKGTKTIFIKFINRIICFSLCLLCFKLDDKNWDTQGLAKFFTASNTKENIQSIPNFIEITNGLLGTFGTPSTFHEIIFEHERRYFQSLFDNESFITAWKKNHNLKSEEDINDLKQAVLKLLQP